MAENAEEQEDKKEEAEEVVCEEGAPGWVVTFGDMMSLLLTFFILLLSFATMDILRYVELAGTIKQGFGLPVQPKLVVVPKAENIIRMQPKIDFNSRRVMEEIRRRLDPNSPTKKTAKVTIEVFESYRGVLILFPADELFVPGTAKLRKTAAPLLDVVAEQASAKINFDLLVEVRRSKDALRAPNYQDVWSLTAAQAVSINRYLRDTKKLDAGNIIAVGRGPAPPTPKPGTTKSPTQGSTVEFTLLSKVMKPK
ncbi:MAG: flagellar motor protein MotB [Myxococcota bacterium]|nr:flagellar motor protein MotB [Myxococcota bacterium]